MKTLLAFVFSLSCISGFSQIKVSVQLGYNLAEFNRHKIAYPDYSLSTSSINAVNTGVVFSLPLWKKMYLQPSLLLTEKGAHKHESSLINLHSESNMRFWYAELPINFAYSVFDNQKWQVMLSAGAYVSRGLWGREKGFANSYDSLGMPLIMTIDRKVIFTNKVSGYQPDKLDVKPMDAGYNITAEVGRGNIRLVASYQHGVVTAMEPDFKNRLFSISVNYFFSRKDR